MSDWTLDDLVSSGDATASAASEAASGGSQQARGPWLVDLYKELRDDGMLGPLLFGPDGAGAVGNQANQTNMLPTTDGNDDEGQKAETDADAPEIDGIEELDAEVIAGICQTIKEEAGDLSVSQIQMACQAKPDMVNRIIEENV